MGFFTTGRQHYLEPLPLRRPTFIDRPSFFSEECDRGHRPSSFDLGGSSNFKYAPKPTRGQSFYKALLEKFDEVISPRTSLLDSALLGSGTFAGRLSPSPIERASLDVSKQLSSKVQRGEYGFSPVSPVSETGSTTLVSSSYVSPFEESHTSPASFVGKYESDLAPISVYGERWSAIPPASESPRSTQSEVGPLSNPFSDKYEYSPSPITTAVERRTAFAQDSNSPVPWYDEVSYFSVSDSSGDKSPTMLSSHSLQSPWEEDVASPTITVSDNASTRGHEADTPRLFLEELSPLHRASGHCEYTSFPTFTSTGYGTFVAQVPFTPRSPRYLGFSTTDILQHIRNDGIYQYFDQESHGVWEDVFFCIGALMFLAAFFIYVFALLSILKYTVSG